MIKKYIFPLVLFVCSISYGQEYKKMISKGTFTFKEIQKEANNYFSIKGEGRGTGYKQYKRWEYNAKRKVDENGFVKRNSFYINELKRYNAELNLESKSSRLAVNSWEQLGPTNVTVTTGYNPGIGRITHIAIDPNDANHMIIGAHSGGVWRTIDKGGTWTPLSDNFTSMDVYSLAIHPTISSTYYWGGINGEIYKSTNSGTIWSKTQNIEGGDVTKIIINPNDPKILFATGQGFGIYKSIDSGDNWTKVTTDTDGLDVEFKPGDYNTIYATGKNFNKSTDGGATWSVISGFDNEGLKQVGVSPHNASIVYVIEEKNGVFNGFYASSDSGAIFTKKDHTGKNYFGSSIEGTDTRGQAPRDMAIAVSTTNSNEVHIAGINPYRSLDGGTTFTMTAHWAYDSTVTDLGYCHADIDDVLYYGNELFVVSDGGVYVANDPAGAINNTYYKDLTTGMGIHQFYKIGVFQDATSKVTGGSQDNGTTSYINSTWKNWFGADGGPSFFHNTNSNIIYGTTQEGGVVKTTDGADNLDGTFTSPTGKGNFITPFIPDPTENETIYIGYEQVFKSIDGSDSWSSISQDFGTKLDLLAIAPTDNKTIYAVIGEKLFKTTTGGSSGDWTEVTTIPSGFIIDVKVHPKDANKIAIATTHQDMIFISTDGGVTWNAKKTGLPSFSANVLAWQDNAKDGLYVGMSYGIYYIDNTLSSWQNYSNLIPNVSINDLTINTAESKLYAGTWGRGVWRIPLFGVTLSTEDSNLLDKKISAYPNPVSKSLNIVTDLNTKAEIRLFSLDGKLVYFSKEKSLRNHKIDTSEFSSGIYFLRINSENQIITRKIIKE
ncbi:putative secreted protein (Por secretion system target) [Lutibacter sp. Hel_I_33_5]|uniref:T9SS type A sorting domain-containing protein n=1 Tax=Lutibacter sp. Hel_I_33_5 TaxID=1566289 RepID=UPI0011A0CE17|nr:T9SS type A sorting domain-containing protein [Lutibacter sp. Hel_I_33_5]TVZ55339.1 putative secreted protein (Por secretion system target) [Lutibacter sp. Hel_I_33_5]